MRILLYKFVYLLFFQFFFSFFQYKAEDLNLDNYSDQQNQIFIESNLQRSDLKNSIFYAEGNVIITNAEKEFIAKSKKAIFYKLTGEIKLIGNVEVINSDSSKIKAGEILYSLKEDKFEAVSDLNQRVNSKFLFESE